MGAAQSVPVVGEVVTAVDSGARLVVGDVVGVAGLITGNEKMKASGERLIESAGHTWIEYSERNVLAAPIRAGLHGIAGNEDEAERVLKKCGNSVVELADGTPVVGHAKGIYHYAKGETEKGNACMKGATRSLAVAGAGALTGGLGAGVVVGGLAGVGSGVAYDGTCTLIESGVKDEFTPSGTISSIAGLAEAIEDDDLDSGLESALALGYSVTGDFITGAESATAAKKAKTVKQKRDLAKKIGKEAADDTIDAARNVRDLKKNGKLKQDNYVSTRVRDTSNNTVYDGLNERTNRELRLNEFEKKGKASGYTGKNQAKKGTYNPRTKTKLQVLSEQEGLKITKKKKVPTATLR